MNHLAQAVGAALSFEDLAAGPRWFDDVLPDPDAIRRAVLEQPVIEVPTVHGVFRGIRPPGPWIGAQMVGLAQTYAPGHALALTFARQSPLGQDEPNDVHSDADHGTLTGILYLNQEPTDGDGTSFWRHHATGAVRGAWDEACQADSHDRNAWTRWRHVEARYNRLLLFAADFYHSRGIVANYGAGDDARLIQVLFLQPEAPRG